MPNSEKRRRVSVEDLLHLKRAERPGPEFWANFEHELRQKQLTALMQKRSWWQGMPQLFARRAAYLPLGATAILTFTLITIKYGTPAQLAQSENPATSAAPTLQVSVETPVAPTVATTVSSPLLNHNDQSALRMDDRIQVIASNLPVAPADAEPANSSTESVLVETPSARTIAANLAHLEQSEPELTYANLGNRLSTAGRVQATATPVGELVSLTASASKRSRILANYNDRQLNPEPTAPDLVRERLSQRLGDADYAERFSRIGLKGDQVSLGFTIKL